MIDLYYWPTPNGKKVSIMLEECELEYKPVAVNIGRGDQFTGEFLDISPNNRIPAIVDHDNNRIPAIVDHDPGISLFESGAILMYLAEKSGKLMPQEMNEKYEVLQWLFWQMAGLGPMAGQLSHFVNYAPEPVPYAHTRYEKEYDRLLGVMNSRLADREFLAGDYSIADIASFPWVAGYKRLGTSLDAFPNLRRWFDEIKKRPAVRIGMDLGDDWRKASDLTDEEARKILFGQTAESIAKARQD
jgi:GST-like protein